MHSGTEDLKSRWVEEKAVKECGWPAHIVKQYLTNKRLVEDWGLLQQALNRALLGQTDDTGELSHETEAIDEDELAAYDARFVDTKHLIIPLPLAPLQLHIVLLSEDRVLPSAGEPPPMYITSTTVAAYVRLHILSQLLYAFRNSSLIDQGESVVMAAIRFIEEAWVTIEDNGPPEMSDVLRHFLHRQSNTPQTQGNHISGVSTQRSSKLQQTRTTSSRDGRDDGTVKADFERVRHSQAYADIIASRSRLPAFTAREQFLNLLRSNRCIVVVGETGNVSVTPHSNLGLIFISHRLRKNYTM